MAPDVSTKRIVCLANSRKLGGCCIAGKQLLDEGSPGPWVRPVSAREHEEVSLPESRCTDGSIPRVLDVIEVPVLGEKRRDYQQENWLLDPKRKWKKSSALPFDRLHEWADNTRELWINGVSTYQGLNDQVPEQEAATFRHSLLLIPVQELALRVFAPGAGYGDSQKRVNGHFTYNGIEYRLRMTDNDYEYDFLQRPVGVYSINRCFVTVSLGEPYKGNAYKLIAAIIKA